MLRTVIALALVVALWSCVSAQKLHDVNQIRYNALSNLVWRDSEWALAFRVTSGIRQSTYDTYVDKFRDDDRPLARAFTPWECHTVSRDCDRHYRSSILNDWPSAYIDEVRISLIEDDKEVAYILFNGTNSTTESWFSKDRVLNSTWTDLTTEPSNYFSIPGHKGSRSAGSWNRRFYMNRNYGGCSKDNGWLMVLDQDNDVCPWGKLNSPNLHPAIFYSKEKKYVNFNSGKVGRADTMVIAVKFFNRN